MTPTLFIERHANTFNLRSGNNVINFPTAQAAIDFATVHYPGDSVQWSI